MGLFVERKVVDEGRYIEVGNRPVNNGRVDG